MILFGSNLKHFRRRMHLKQQDLADALNVDKSTIYLWENGKREPSFKNVESVANLFNVPVCELFAEHSEKDYHDCKYCMGYSDIAKISLFGKKKLSDRLIPNANELHFEEDGIYDCYIVDSKDCLIPEHYKKFVDMFDEIVTVINDVNQFDILADHIEVYRSGKYGVMFYCDNLKKISEGYEHFKLAF